MNPLFASVFLVATLTAVSAQQGNCGCASQPTVIQMTCGGGGNPVQAYPPAPPPPPPGYWGGSDMDHDPSSMEDIMNMCQFDDQGYPIGNPPGGFPAGFRIIQDEHGNTMPIAPPGFEIPEPPPNWDGRLETLGFDLPQPGTPYYNMILCYPLPVITAGAG